MKPLHLLSSSKILLSKCVFSKEHLCDFDIPVNTKSVRAVIRREIQVPLDLCAVNEQNKVLENTAIFQTKNDHDCASKSKQDIGKLTMADVGVVTFESRTFARDITQ